MKPGILIPLWKESRYLGLVLEQARHAKVETVILWQDEPLFWTSDRPCPSGWNDPQTAAVLDSFLGSGFYVSRMKRAPQGGPYGGYGELLDLGFGMLRSRHVETVVIMDSDWIMDLPDVARLFSEIRTCDEPGMFWGVDAKHYWRNWETTFATSGICVGFPVDKGKHLFDGTPRLPQRYLNITCYHPSYVLTDEEMHDKVHAFGHADDFKKQGFYEKWLAKDDSQQDLRAAEPPPMDVLLRLLHWKAG